MSTREKMDAAFVGVNRALRNLDDAFLECRMMSNHPFRRVPVAEVPDQLLSDTSIGWSTWGFLCPRCGMWRIDTWDINGRLSSRRYLPPEGYRLNVDPSQRPMAADFRVEVMRREKQRRKLAAR